MWHDTWRSCLSPAVIAAGEKQQLLGSAVCALNSVSAPFQLSSVNIAYQMLGPTGFWTFVVVVSGQLKHVREMRCWDECLHVHGSYTTLCIPIISNGMYI